MTSVAALPVWLQYESSLLASSDARLMVIRLIVHFLQGVAKLIIRHVAVLFIIPDFKRMIYADRHG